MAEVFEGDNPSFSSCKYCGKTGYKSPEIISKKSKFNAKSNDIWCVGVCLFMMIIGAAPWKKASKKDPCFNWIMNGKIIELLSSWNKLCHVNLELISLFQSFFKYEKQRINLNSIKNCKWLKKSKKKL